MCLPEIYDKACNVKNMCNVQLECNASSFNIVLKQYPQKFRWGP